jgi:hypothetical protein
MAAHCGYGLLGCLAVPLWLAGLAIDGVWCGLHQCSRLLAASVKLS